MPKKNKLSSKAKKNIKRSVIAGVSALVVSSALISGVNGTLSFYNTNLPNNSQIKQNIENLDACDTYNNLYSNRTGFSAFIHNQTTTRLVLTSDQPVLVVLDDSFNQTAVKYIKMYIEEVNELFEHINPKYKFEVVNDVSFLQKINKNTIFCTVHQNQFEDLGEINQAKANVYTMPAANATGLATCFATLHFKSDFVIDSQYCEGINLFSHEFMHALGLGDEYLRSLFCMTYSVMNNMKGVERPITKVDAKVLASIYGDFTTEEKVQEFEEFLTEFYKGTREHPEFVREQFEKQKTQIENEK